MGRSNTIHCDIPGCTSSEEQTRKSGSLRGWIRRDITDSANKLLAEGMRDHGERHETLFLCPAHAQIGQTPPNPPLHPDLVAWLLQPEPNTHLTSTSDASPLSVTPTEPTPLHAPIPPSG